MKNIKYTRHSKNRMRWHNISEDDIKICLSNADFVEEVNDKINACKKIENKFLRVTYIEEASEYVIITAVYKKKFTGGKL